MINTATTKTLTVSKSNIDELSLRKSMYWVSEDCIWDIADFADYWEIHITCSSEKIDKEYAKLNSLVNDYTLRYKLSSDSKLTRESIIKKALLRLAEDD